MVHYDPHGRGITITQLYSTSGDHERLGFLFSHSAFTLLYHLDSNGHCRLAHARLSRLAASHRHGGHQFKSSFDYD
jgi:hypothetical protein